MKQLSIWLSRRMSGEGVRNTSGTGRTGAIIAILGIAFAVAVMEVTLSVSVGFKRAITEKLEGFVAPVTVSHIPDGNGAASDKMIALSSELIEPVLRIAPGAKIIPVVTQSAMLKTDSDFAAIVLKGYEADYPATFERSNLIEGEWLKTGDKRSIVISTEISRQLGLKTGDRVNACFFTDEKVKTRPFVVSGMYETGLGEYDNLVAYTSSDAIRAAVHSDSTMVSAIELYNIPAKESASVAQSLSAEYYRQSPSDLGGGPVYYADSIQNQGAMYLNWLDLFDTNVVVIFILMSLVAASTLISSLFIQVLEKVNTIGLLRAIGAPDKMVGDIFVYISLRLVGWGIVIGNVIGLGVIFVQYQWHLISLDPEMYYLNYVPVEIMWLPILLLNIAVIIATWLIQILPARIATRMSPARTLRFD